MTLRPPLLSGPVQLEELPRFFSAPFAPSLACQILGVINTAAMKTATRQSKVMSLASPAASMRKPPLSQGVGNDGPRLRRRSAGRVDAGARTESGLVWGGARGESGADLTASRSRS